MKKNIHVTTKEVKSNGIIKIKFLGDIYASANGTGSIEEIANKDGKIINSIKNVLINEAEFKYGACNVDYISEVCKLDAGPSGKFYHAQIYKKR